MKRMIVIHLLTGLLLLVGGRTALYADAWSYQPGFWNDSSTWVDNVGTPKIPEPNDNWVYVYAGRDVTVNSAGACKYLIIGNWYGPATAVHVQPGADLALSGLAPNSYSLSVGYNGQVGTLRMTGGTITSGAYTIIGDGAGVYDPNTAGYLYMSDGLLQTTGDYGILDLGKDDAKSEIYQTGGTIDVSAALYMNKEFRDTGDTKYVISGDSVLHTHSVIRHWNYIGQWGDAEFRIIGSEPSVTMDLLLWINNAQGSSEVTLGFEIDNETGVSPITVLGSGDVGGGQHYGVVLNDATFDVSGGKNGMSYVLIDSTSPILFNTASVTDPSRYEVRHDTANHDIVVDVIAPACNTELVGDFDGNCIVDLADFGELVAHWQETAYP